MPQAFGIIGLNVVIVSLSRASANAKERAGKVVEETARRVETTAKELCPRLTGSLAGSIHTTPLSSWGVVSAEVGPSSRYGSFVEFGTYKDAPQAYMGPALDRHSGDFERLIAEAGDL
jgi:HK97 gp10 family phage protein